MGLIEVFLLLAFGFAVGLPMAMVGLGGGLLFVPTLILVFGLQAQNAVAISLVAMTGTTLSASVGYMRQGRVDYKLALLYDILDVPGVIAGAYLTIILPKNILTGVCGFFVVAISLLLIRNRRAKNKPASEASPRWEWRRMKVDSSNRVFEYVIHQPALALASSFLSGLVGGLAGLGGGITDTTTMILLGVPPHVAIATSELAMAFTNGVGVLAHGILQNILWDYAIPLIVGTFVGAQIGVLASKRVKGKTLRNVLSVIALIMGLRLVLLLFQI
jgi:uncharacterized membrane protein YfcA